TYYDVALAVKAGADAIVLDGMQGGTAATQEVFIEHVGIPILAAIPQAVESLQELGMHREVQLIVSGGSRTGADVAKALALGADAGPRVRQVARPQPRAGGPGGADDRGGRHGAGAARRDELGPGEDAGLGVDLAPVLAPHHVEGAIAVDALVRVGAEQVPQAL